MLKAINISEEGRYGGPQARIAMVAEELKRLDIETIVLCPEDESERFQRDLSDRGIEWRAEWLFPPSTSPGRFVRYVVTFIPQLVRLMLTIRSLRAEVVHCNGLWQFKSILAAKLSGRKVVLHLNDTTIPFPLTAIWPFVRRLADGFIFASNETKKVYFSSVRTNSPTAVIQAPVDTELFDPGRSDASADVSSLPGLKIVSVANVNPTKNLEVFVEAAAFVSREFDSDDVSFVVAGAVLKTQRAYARKLKTLVDRLGIENLHFLGPVEDVPSLLSSADVYVCSSRREASPMAIWEAMSMAIPVVSTDVGDVRQFVGEGGCGYVVPVGEADELADRITLLARNQELRRKLGLRARQVARSRLDVTVCAQRHADFYKRVVLAGL